MTDNANPPGKQFEQPPIMGNNRALTFTAIDFSVREPGRPPGSNTTFSPPGQSRNDETFETICSNSDHTMKTGSHQAQVVREYAV